MCGAILKATDMMQSVTLQSPADADGKGTAEQSPFICLPAEIRNKIYRYSMVEGPSGARIRGFSQPPLTRVNCQIRSEALPIYYGRNKFLLSIPHVTPRSDPNAWPDFIKTFEAFKAGRTGGRGTGSLQFIQNLKCEMVPTAAEHFRLLEICFKAIEGPRVAPDIPDMIICGDQRTYNAVFATLRTIMGSARRWQDWDSVYTSLEKHLDKSGVKDPSGVYHLISAVVMVAKECPGATKEIHLHSVQENLDGMMLSDTWEIPFMDIDILTSGDRIVAVHLTGNRM